MKKILSILMIGVLLSTNALSAYAGSSETVNIAITINHTKSIEVSGNPGLSINPGEAAVSDPGITVKNNGTGIDETVSLVATITATVPTDWTMQFQFADTRPEVGDSNWKNGPDIRETLAYNETKKLWVKLTAPKATKDTSISITITISAS